MLVHLVAGDAGAQVRILDAAGRVLADIALGDIGDVRTGHAAESAGRDVLTLILKQPLGDFPTAVEPAHQLVLGHLHIGEEGFAEGRRTADQLDGTGFDPGGGHVEQDEGNALVFLAGVSAHQAEDPVGLVGVGGPDLLAVDQEVVALVLAAGLEAGQIGAGARFRIALAPADLALDDPGKELLLLLLGGVFQQHRAQHPDAEAAQGRPGLQAAQFLVEDLVLFLGQPAAAILGRPHGRGPALGRHAVHPQLDVGIGIAGIAAAPGGVVFRHRRMQGRRIVGLQPGAGFSAEGFQFGGAKVSHVGFSQAVRRPRGCSPCRTQTRGLAPVWARLSNGCLPDWGRGDQPISNSR